MDLSTYLAVTILLLSASGIEANQEAAGPSEADEEASGPSDAGQETVSPSVAVKPQKFPPAETSRSKSKNIFSNLH